MSFLSPWFIAGLLAVALPIVFHMIRRTPHGRVPFSTLMFLSPSPPRMTRRSRLDNWLLLLLRALALCLLALAFARPFFRTESAAELDSGRGRRVAVLIDTSAGMRRGTLWNDALARARQVIGAAQPGERFGVFTYDRRVNAVLDFEEWSQLEPAVGRELVEQRLKELQPSWAGADLGQALATAAEALAATDRQDEAGQVPGPKQIVVVSDLKLGSKLNAVQTGAWPQDVQVLIERLPVAETTNAGLQLVSGAHAALSDEDANRPRVRVSNAADSIRERFRLVWAGGERSAGGESVEVYVPPGTSRVVRAPRMPRSLAQARLVLEGDDHDFDNTIFVELTSALTLPVFYYGQDAADDPQGLRYYFERAFPETPGRVVEVTAQDPAGPPWQQDALDVRLIVVTEELTEPHVARLRQYLQGGGTVVQVLRTPADARTLAALLDAAPERLTVDEADVDGYAMLTHIDFSHELFAPFADARFSDFTKIRIWKHRRVQFESLDGRVPARFDNGDPAVVEFPSGRGRVLLLTSGWHPDDSQWALSSKFVPLLNGILETSGVEMLAGARYVVGDAVPLSRSASAGDSPATVRLPDGGEVEVPPGRPSFTQTSLPGVYTAQTPQGPLRFVVDLDPEESKTSPLPLERLEALGVRLAATESSAAAEARLQQQRQLHARELESRQKAWRWLLVAAIGVLLLETWLAGRFSRRLTANDGAESLERRA